MQKYTRKQFEADYPDDDACLDKLFYLRFGGLKWCPRCGVIEAQFVRVEGRKCYACVHCRHQLYPMAGTIFEKSTTPLKLWFEAMYMFSISKNGVSSLELQRALGTSKKVSWRIGMKIREAMKQDFSVLLDGTVECDEAYYGGRRRSSNRYSNKTPLLGAVERGGRARVLVLKDHATTANVKKFIRDNVSQNAQLQTDESRLYYWAYQWYRHHTVQHGARQYVVGDDYTNNVEGWWGRFKPSLLGTHRSVSKHWLQTYVNEHVWRYNHREQQLFPLLVDAVAQQI